MQGLDVFRAWFADYPDQYILIGGTAATLAMEEAGLDFRATKDLDVVLHVEALTPAFGETFWRFIEAGGYEIRQASATGKPGFYRCPSFPQSTLGYLTVCRWFFFSHSTSHTSVSTNELDAIKDCLRKVFRC